MNTDIDLIRTVTIIVALLVDFFFLPPLLLLLVQNHNTSKLKIIPTKMEHA